jgi:hypothetical protein
VLPQPRMQRASQSSETTLGLLGGPVHTRRMDVLSSNGSSLRRARIAILGYRYAVAGRLCRVSCPIRGYMETTILEI